MEKEILEQFPESKTSQFPIQVGVRISVESANKLKKLEEHGRKQSDVLRKLIDDGLKKVAV